MKHRNPAQLENMIEALLILKRKTDSVHLYEACNQGIIYFQRQYRRQVGRYYQTRKYDRSEM